ncbi:allophanate hydrolase subunit 1 [Loktanella sp. R86503]|uniref:5-oxoprolinase subunit B family protein n=1 Tax=Loktanella sp. R86503 TaxID=3093847 RepID=UPI0036DE5B2D
MLFGKVCNLLSLPDDTWPKEAWTLSPLGQDGIVVRFGDGHQAQTTAAISFGAAVRAAALQGVVEVATALTSVLVRFDPVSVARAAVDACLRDVLSSPHVAGPAQGRLWTIPACFGGESGPQFADAAALAGLSEEAARAELAAAEVSVLAIGFAPGQPYLGHLPQAWDLPRQQALTPQVPAGALVVALRQLVLFANPSPTGWRGVGRCAFRPFMAERAVPFALRAGDRVRWELTDAATIAALAEKPDGLGGALCEVAE